MVPISLQSPPSEGAMGHSLYRHAHLAARAPSSLETDPWDPSWPGLARVEQRQEPRWQCMVVPSAIWVVLVAVASCRPLPGER